MTQPTAVIFDVGNVLFEWNLRFLYKRLIEDDRALDAFLRDVVTMEWHLQHDAGRPFAETSAELIAQHPDHADLIAALGPRFNETIRGVVPGMAALVGELHEAGVPLFAITNFSGEFWRPFRVAHATFFDRFGDVVVSGDEGLMKPDRAIYELALARFGLAAGEAFFVDDNIVNVEAAAALGIAAHHFTGVAPLQQALTAMGLLAG
ncbi:MAG: HAD-IA family hydrolase [Sphingomonas sp.]|nr:HAD-IA family hydrolase [Sphingomonas sp.]